MNRPVARPVAGLVAGLVAGVVAGLSTLTVPSPAAAAPPGRVVRSQAAADDSPLSVSITGLTPSTMPRRGRDLVTVTGTVTNRSTSTWVDMNVYLLTSFDPIPNTAALAEAAASDPAQEVGPRLTDPGLFATIPDLEPGGSAPYRLSVRRDQLQISGKRGVYWLGVHVLGADESGRVDGADGRARTFLPLVGSRTPITTLALALPFRAVSMRYPDGRLVNEDDWQRWLSPDGRLTRLLGLAQSNGTAPLSLLVDPAVLDAAASVAADNPPKSFAPDPPEGEPSEPSPAEGSGEDGAGAAGSDGGDASPSPIAATAAAWLAGLTELAKADPVLATPYGDVDVASALRRGYRPLLTQALALSADAMTARGLPATPVLAPVDGYFPDELLAALDTDLPLILSDGAFPRADSLLLDSSSGQRVLLADSGAIAGGPGSKAPPSALAMRQRILAEAAVHAFGRHRGQAMLVSLPGRWDPGPDWAGSDFFAGFEVPWLTRTSVPDLLSTPSSGDPVGPGTERPLTYPEELEAAELPTATLQAAADLVEAGNTLAGLLTRNDTVDEQLARQAMLSASEGARGFPRRAAQRANDSREYVATQLEKVGVQGPSFVVISGERGDFQVTLVNGLDQPVTVGLRASAPGGSGLELTTPEPVTIPSGRRRAVRVKVTATEIGVYGVTVQPTNPDGALLGTEASFSVRSSHVGLIIWLIMAVGGAVLFGAIAVRIRRRVLARRATHGPLLANLSGDQE